MPRSRVRARRPDALRSVLAAGCVVGWLLSPVGEAAAQMVPATGSGPGPESWMTRWSPLTPLGDLPRGMPGAAPGTPGLLLTPAPRASLFWSLGNPAALATEPLDGWSTYRVGGSKSEGEYRRPLDPAREDRLRISAEGWSEAGSRSAAAGRVVLDRVTHGAPALANVAAPYGSSPLVVLDTAHSDLGSTAARLEGALAVELGAFGLGVALGFDALETRTVAAPVPQAIRAAVPGATAGATWKPLGSDRFQVGVHGRWQHSMQRINLYSLAAPTRVYHLAGYGEIPPVNVVSTFYRREMERTSRGAGAGLQARLAGARLIAFAELSDAEEEQSTIEVNDPPLDVWAADQLRFGAVMQRRFLADQLLIHASATQAEVTGRARLHEQDDRVVFTTDESALHLSLDTRLDLDSWSFGARLTGARHSRTAVDSTVSARSEIRSWTTGGSLEGARRLGHGFSAAAGAALNLYRAAGAIPNPLHLGESYNAYVGPELALYGSDATARAGTFTLRWDRPAGGPGVFLHARAASAVPGDEAGLPLARRDARRSGWSITFGAIVR